jgi:hypothetical protein
MAINKRAHAPGATVAASVEDRIIRAEELAHRARVFLDIWVAMTLDTAVEPFTDVLDEYDEFFRFTRVAHEATFISRITNLLQPHKSAENLPALINDASRREVITADVVHRCRAALVECDPMFRKVKLIRDNAMAHQHRYRQQTEIYIEAQVTLDGMVELSDQVILVTGDLMEAIGLRRRIVLTNPVAALERMLSMLKERST